MTDISTPLSKNFTWRDRKALQNKLQKEREEARAKRSPQEQLEDLDARQARAVKERVRLQKLINSES